MTRHLPLYLCLCMVLPLGCAEPQPQNHRPTRQVDSDTGASDQGAAAVRYYRRAAGLTQEQLAANSGVTVIPMLESGHRGGTRDTTLEKIAAALSRSLGFELTVADLRVRPAENVDAVVASFGAFAEEQGDKLSAEEKRVLLSIDWGGLVPTKDTWTVMLAGIRQASPNK